MWILKFLADNAVEGGGWDVARSACWTYVTWYNGLSSGDWATWLPGRNVEPGSVGTFNGDRRFDHYETLEELGITCAKYSEETPGEDGFYGTAGGFTFEPKIAGNAVPGFATLGELDAGVKLTAKAAHACLLQLVRPTVKQVTNQRQVQEAVLAQAKGGQWNIDSQIVMSRTRCNTGFAAISQAAGQSLELKAAGKLPAVITEQNLGGLELRLASSRATTDFLLTVFSLTSTPVFGGVVRLKRSLLDKLLPWRSEGGYLVDPNGKRFRPRNLPLDLSTAYAPADRRYDPARSAMSLAELSGLTVGDAFEEVASLPDEGESSSPVDLATALRSAVRRFALPRSLVPSPLAAADDDDASVLLDASFADGRAHFTVYDRGLSRYWLEVTLRYSSPEPSVVMVRYQATDGTEQDLMVPVGGDSTATPSSMVSLRAYRPGTDGQAWLLGELYGLVWPEEIIRRSVQAAIGNGTAETWERLALQVSAETGEVIDRELRALRGTT
jgi:hypothetical protein